MLNGYPAVHLLQLADELPHLAQQTLKHWGFAFPFVINLACDQQTVRLDTSELMALMARSLDCRMNAYIFCLVVAHTASQETPSFKRRLVHVAVFVRSKEDHSPSALLRT